ncbi:hypothetical protein ASG52_24520 [Methylobacterium sp. Leaf456]|uniref:hypothetical protein n=1 Tax=Methylobacterium sp. Leaf456 TaxID=1736382 RepID=UPI0006F77FD7|nr:hypothetical protein [Methylobacterium sp. Leaf456]KQT56088.1 hypothetical protein ASG52_24520 [Methylobacterium sp. Leaf456]
MAAGRVAQPQGYSAIGDLFGSFGTAFATQAANERAAALSGGAYKAPYSTGLFGGRGAVKNTA